MIDINILQPLAAFLLGGLLVYLYLRSDRKTDVLFFPDAKMPCNSFYRQMLGDSNFRCRRSNCEFAHSTDDEPTSLMEMIACLSKAEQKIDLCVFEFTQNNLAEFLISLVRTRGVRVRIITDAHRDRRQSNNEVGSGGGDQRQQGLGDQIPRLQGAGLQVRVNPAGADDRALMHNKFVLIDDKHLIMGSFNWTHNAVRRNQEAVISTNESRVVKKFVSRFEEIWDSTEIRQREVPAIRVR